MPTVVIAVVLAVVLLATALVLGRRRRETALEPVRLGPSWRPGQDEASGDLRDPDAVARRAGAIAERTGTDRAVVSNILDVWDEYLGVLGLAPLAADHRRLVYDPYDPPVAQRGPDGRPQPDPDRVARDAAGRLGVAESVAQDVLRALDGDDTDVHRVGGVSEEHPQP